MLHSSQLAIVTFFFFFKFLITFYNGYLLEHQILNKTKYIVNTPIIMK